MRVVLALLLASTAATLCSGQSSKPSGVYLDNELANRVIDSLYARADWKRAYDIRTAQLALEQGRHQQTEELRRQDSLYCDSILWDQHSDIRDLAYENGVLAQRGKKTPLLVTVAALVGVIIGALITQ